MKNYSRIYASIDLNAISYNMHQMKENISKDTKIIAVIKADGYGHGAAQIARLLTFYEYVWGFAVATIEEAVSLRKKQINKPILILGYVFPEDYESLIDYEIRPTVFTYEMAKELSRIAVKKQKTVHFHIKVDTGMSRIGFADTSESTAIIEKISNLPNVNIEGLFTHFAKADEEDKTVVYEQLQRYLLFAEKVNDRGIQILIRHCSNSAGIIDIKEANLDAVRAGISIYGIYPSNEVKKSKVKLMPAMSLKSHISYVKTVEQGVGISYGWTHMTDLKTTIATIPVGYADGYPRMLSNAGWVLVHGQKAPILGRICMDQFMVDVTGISGVSQGDEVTLLGKDGEEQILVEDLSKLCGRFPYEFVCDISKRVPRVYRRDDQIVETSDCFEE